MRARITVIAASLSVIVFCSLWSPTGPRGVLPVTFALVGSAVAAAGAVLWASRWPSRRQAIAFAVASTTAIALAVLAQSAPIAGLFGCAAFVALAVHIAFFYAAPVVIYNVVCAAATAGVEAFRLIPSVGLATSLSAYWVVLMVNLVAPLGLRITGQVLGQDAFLSSRDPLTGLLNRRAFYTGAEEMLRKPRTHGVEFVVAVIDLDRFKQLNDQYGHAVGDEVLAAVAQALRDTSTEFAVIGRVGGEEFAVADCWSSTQRHHRAQKLCDAIASLPFDVTASVGSVSLAGNFTAATSNAREMLGDLVSEADAAMYAAKAQGGNRTCHETPQPPSPIDAGSGRGILDVLTERIVDGGASAI